jgi:hypothetical protein
MKRNFAADLFAVAVSILLSSPVAAQNTRTFSLVQGSTITPASPGFDASGVPTYFGGLVAGQVSGPTPSTFTLSVAFRSTGVIDQVAGIYGGEILSPYSSFAVTQMSGRKSVSTSGTIDGGRVTYRLTDGRAEIISVVSNNLTVWEGKNKRRTAVGTGTLNYGPAGDGSGTMTLIY